jgi:hypothetical protein
MVDGVGFSVEEGVLVFLAVVGNDHELLGAGHGDNNAVEVGLVEQLHVGKGKQLIGVSDNLKELNVGNDPILQNNLFESLFVYKK